MNQGGGRLPRRGPPQRLPPTPPLPGVGGDIEKPYVPPIAPPSPFAETVPRVFEAERTAPLTTTTGLALPEAGTRPVIGIPRNWQEVEYWIALMNPARELSVILEQAIAPSATGSVSASIPSNTVDVARFFREGGDGSVTYNIEIDGVGRRAIADHRITGGERVFARYFEKYSTVTVNFTNNDAVNTALVQIEWISLQLESSDWLGFRDYLRTWGAFIGIVE